jgi:hypothetical protein
VGKFDKGKSLLQLIDRKKFNELCEKWGMDKGVRSYLTWQQTGVLVMSYLMRLESSREIEAVLGVARSTFCDANQNRSAGFFEDLCEMILMELRWRSRGRKIRRALKELLAIDSTECRIHGSISSYLPWRQKRSKQGAAKLHVVWNIDGEWVEDFRITSGRKHDAPIALLFEISSGKMYVFDRAYNDIGFWWKITDKGSDFTSRLKDSARHHYHRKIILAGVGEKTGVLWDGQWKPTQPCLRLHPEVPKDFKCRHIIYRDPETKKIFDFVTSNFKSPAQKIADTYKKRWAVELLFRWFKGHLKIRYFETRNPNALKIQLAVAVLVQLLVQLYRTVNKFRGTLWECLRAIRTDLALKGLEESGFPRLNLRKPLVEAGLTN